MFNTFAYSAVDAVQSAKKQFVSTFVQHEDLAKTLNTFVDAQSDYTKKAIAAGIDVMTSFGSILSTKEFYSMMFDPFKVATKKGK